MRALWSDERAVTYRGVHYQLAGVHPGPQPAHPIEIWLGGSRPRMLKLIGEGADGWIPSLGYVPPDAAKAGNEVIDEAALALGRAPNEIRRAYNMWGDFDSPDVLVDLLTDLALDVGMDTFLYWPSEDPFTQIKRFAEEVIPQVRELVARARS
jgi:hypothetical protein